MAGRDEMPHGLEAVVAGKLHGVMSAVVEATGFTVDIADRGVRDGDAVEARGYVDESCHVSMMRFAGTVINVDRINVDQGLR